MLKVKGLINIGPILSPTLILTHLTCSEFLFYVLSEFLNCSFCEDKIKTKPTIKTNFLKLWTWYWFLFWWSLTTSLCGGLRLSFVLYVNYICNLQSILCNFHITFISVIHWVCMWCMLLLQCSWNCQVCFNVSFLALGIGCSKHC